MFKLAFCYISKNKVISFADNCLLCMFVFFHQYFGYVRVRHSWIFYKQISDCLYTIFHLRIRLWTNDGTNLIRMVPYFSNCVIELRFFTLSPLYFLSFGIWVGVKKMRHLHLRMTFHIDLQLIFLLSYLINWLGSNMLWNCTWVPSPECVCFQKLSIL